MPSTSPAKPRVGLSSASADTVDSTTSSRPVTPRAQTAAFLDTAVPATHSHTPTHPPTHARPRNPSPYARSHLRTQSTSALLRAPPMTRAHSLPTVMHPLGNLILAPTSAPTSAPLARPASPLRSPNRYGSALRPASVASLDRAPSVCDISEDAELDLTPRPASVVSSLYSSTALLSRRRRPASPLFHATPTAAASSPLLPPSKFSEQYPVSVASSSVPSTPTSMRSRSPSISSLETIEDSPDAEEEAIELDRIARLKAAADRHEGEEEQRASMDGPDGRGRSLGFGKRDSRKRWSVCGAERRQDLDLETIWED